MSQLERILQYRSHVDAAEVEDVRARAIARLTTFSLPRVDDPAVPVEATDADAIEIDVIDHPEPIALPLAGPWAAPADDTVASPPASIIALGSPVRDVDAIVERVAVVVPLDVQPAAPKRPAHRRPAKRSMAKPRVHAAAYCPYCALTLDPPPETDRRCTRCRQRIVVRQVDGGMLVYLTEAALKVFDAERERAANIERWTIERRQWLDLARSVGAPASRIERLERPVATLDSVAAARAFYDETVGHAVDEALSRDLWEVAARHRREQADSLRLLAGPRLPASDEIRGLYRTAAAIELRGIGTVTRNAAIVAARCCDTCRADDGSVHRVAGELRTARLPHADCPHGLCRCRWDFAPRDVQMIERYLERTRVFAPEATPA